MLAISRVAERTCTDGTHLCKLGIFGDFDAPTLVVSQVPVEAVHLVERHDVEHFLNFFLVEEVAGNVKHVTAVAEVRLIGDVYQGESPVGISLYLRKEVFAGHELLQRLERVEPTTKFRRCDDYTVGRGVEGVSFLRLVGISAKPNFALSGSFACFLHSKLNARCLSKLSSKSFCMLLHLIASVCNSSEGADMETLCFASNRKRSGIGDD